MTSTRHEIPGPVIGVIAQIISAPTGHSTLDVHFLASGAPDSPPLGNRIDKVRSWLQLTNLADVASPLVVLGKVLAPYFGDADVRGVMPLPEIDRERIQRSLGEHGLRYTRGGIITHGTRSASRSLEDLLRAHDNPAMDAEFARAMANIDRDPREAVSAASNILETLCKVFIAETPTATLPAKQDLPSLWSEVRTHLGWTPGTTADADLRQMLSGLINVVTGVGALRTHASAAHGAGPDTVALEPRHARLAVSAAHAVATFLLESWVRPPRLAAIRRPWMTRRP